MRRTMTIDQVWLWAATTLYDVGGPNWQGALWLGGASAITVLLFVVAGSLIWIGWKGLR